MKPNIRLERRRLKALSRAIAALYRPAPLGDFPRQVVMAVEGFFGSEFVTYNEFSEGKAAPFVLSNNGFEQGNNLIADAAPFFIQNPLIAKLAKLKAISGKRVTDEMSIREFQQTDIFNAFYRRIGGDFQMACGFPSGRSNTSLAIALNQKSRDFTDEEVFLFNLIIPHAQQAYQICHALEAAQARASALTAALDRHGGGVLAFNDDYRVVAISSVAEKFAWRLFRCRPREGVILPDELLERVLKLKRSSKSEMPVVRHPLTFLLEDGSSVSLRLSHDPERIQHCLIFEREPGMPTVAQLAPLGLTRRETEVLHWVLQGKTNWETSIILGIASRTIEKHVENIFLKLAVSNRRHLQSRVQELCGSS